MKISLYLKKNYINLEKYFLKLTNILASHNFFLFTKKIKKNNY
jgi:hypothetical protein